MSGLLGGHYIFDPSKVFYSAESLAKALSLSVHTIRKWKAQGRIPYRKFGRSIRYNLNEVIEVISKEGWN